MLGEIIFGGVGAGMYGMLIFVILTVFIAGLMVGRTPEYLGKKVEAFDVQMSMLYFLIFPVMILGFSAIAVLSPTFGHVEPVEPRAAWTVADPVCVYVRGRQQRLGVCGVEREHALVQLHAGHHDAGGRFLMIVPMLAVAGNLATKKIAPPSLGTFPVTSRCLRCC